MWNLFILFVIIDLGITGISAAVTSNYQCSGTNYTGENSFSSYTRNGSDTNLGFAYMVEDPDYTFSCCGRITSWQGTTNNPGVLQFQVWRKFSKDNYTMIGENSYTIFDTTQTNFDFSVDPVDQIVVNKGDFLGWHNEGKEMLMYEHVHFTLTSHATMFRRIKTSNLHPGDTYNWTNIEAYNDRRYALRATYVASEVPTITLTSPITIPDYIQAGAAITRVGWSDAQVPDNATLNVYFQQTANFFHMDFPAPNGLGTGYLTAANTLRPRSTTLTYFAYDMCYNTFTQNQVINVQQTPLVINNLPATVTVNETGTAAQLLHTITCTEPTDQFYCRSKWSTVFPFILKAITTTTFGFYKVEHAVLDYDTTPNYLNLPIECEENTVTGVLTYTSSINVYVNENQPPRLTNLDANIIVDANVSHRGDVVFYVNATDPEGDDLTFTANYGNQYGRFLVTNNGAVSVTQFLTPQLNLSWSLTITVRDTAGNSDIGYLAISLINSDYTVSIRRTPYSPMLVAENTANFTTLYRFQYEDLDQNDTKIWSLSFDNPIMTKYFSIDFDTGEFRTNFVELDYEDLSSVFTYTATVMVGDQKSSATTTFQITITNINEPPRFTKAYFIIEANENIALTTIEGGTLFTNDMVDEDSSEASNAETHEYSLNCSSETHRFLMYPTGQIIYQGPYNMDVSGTPSDVECVVTVTDKYGLSATAGLHIHVLNYNDFAPEFTQANYTTYVAQNTLIGKNLITVSAIDHDSSDDDDNVITYSIRTGTDSGLIQISHTGIIYAAMSFASYTAGATLGPIILEAANHNHATISRTGTASIFLVIPQSTTTVTTTTDRNYGFYEDKRNYMWLILAVLGVAAILFTLSLVLFRVCHLARIRPTCYACCMRGICCRPTTHPRGFGDKGYNLASFGHKVRYNDDEMDGWLKADAPNRPDTLAQPTDDDDDVNGWLRNANEPPSYRRPYEDDDGPDARYADQPLYEMFRIPDNVPSKAQYDDPGNRNTWKNHRANKRPF